MTSSTGILGAPGTNQPQPFVSEEEKFRDGGAWIGQMLRWIAFNFYNYSIRTVFPNSAYNYYHSNNILENFSYYFGEQRNEIFAYAQQLPSGDNIPAPFIAGQQIRNFVDNMMGNSNNMVNPIKNSISAVNLDYYDILDKKMKFDMARMQLKAAPILDALAQKGIQFNGTDKSYNNAAEIDKDETDHVDDYEDAMIKITRSIYYEQELENQFKAQDALHQYVGGVSGTIIEYREGKVSHTHVPSYNTIYDYRSKDAWGKEAMLGGCIQFMTPEEIRQSCPDLTEQELMEITQMARSNSVVANTFRNNYNMGWNNVRWWGNDGRIAVVIGYFITKRDLRTYRKKSSLGRESIHFYEDEKTYQTKEVNDKGGFVHKKGKHIKGEDWTWDVMQGYLIGNRWITNYGYCDYVVRDKTGFPLLPFQFFAHNLTNGFSKSIVSRLKPLEAEYDRIMLKIREKMGRDFGKIFILNGQRMGITDAIEVLTDWKTSGVHVSAGDQSIIQRGENDAMAEKLDGGLEDISQYINMLEVIRREMQQTVSISDYALGQQTDTVGKGVQNQSVANSTLGNTSLYEGLMTFWNKKLQYSADLAKQFIKEGVYSIVISPTQVDLLNVTKDLRSKSIGIYIEANDTINSDNKKFLNQLLFNYSQNAAQMQAEGITLVDALKLMKATTFDEGIEELEAAQKINQQKSQQIQSQQSQAEQQAQMQMQQQAIMLDAQIKQLAEDNANYRNTQNNETKLLLQQNQNIMDALQVIMQGKPDNPILNPPQTQNPAQPTTNG